MKKTQHKIINADASNMDVIPDESVNLIVTSPPYPMIEMWDEIFSEQSKGVERALKKQDALEMFAGMHAVLDRVWDECDRVLAKNGFACINIGDATRTIDGKFQLFSNHSRIIRYFMARGYSVLPDIIWRKKSNSPTKFMGSGMLPAGAYVTYEHEYILIFRKGDKRGFNDKQRRLRQESAYFWEERNVWFSDLWEFTGVVQEIKEKSARERSAAYPLELAYRLINMYSIKGDTVLDPFLGTGTTTLASIAAERNSIGIELDPSLIDISKDRVLGCKAELNNRINKRITDHLGFIASLSGEKLARCYDANFHSFKVKTRQEKNMIIRNVQAIYHASEGNYVCEYRDIE